nr:tetratricopeptide repeat protein [Sphingobium sp. EM0848]
MITVGDNVDFSIEAFNKVRIFYKSQNPIDVDNYVAVLNRLAVLYGSKNRPLDAEMTLRTALSAAQGDGRPDKPQLAATLFEYGAELLTLGRIKEAEHYLSEAVVLMTRPGANSPPSKLKAAKDQLEIARKAQAELLAKERTARRMATENAASEATRNGKIAATPALTALFARLKTAGININMAGAAK